MHPLQVSSSGLHPSSRRNSCGYILQLSPTFPGPGDSLPSVNATATGLEWLPPQTTPPPHGPARAPPPPPPVPRQHPLLTTFQASAPSSVQLAVLLLRYWRKTQLREWVPSYPTEPLGSITVTPPRPTCFPSPQGGGFSCCFL